MFGNEYTRKPNAAERIKAADTLGKYGLGTKMDVTSDDQPVKAFINIDDSRM